MKTDNVVFLSVIKNPTQKETIFFDQINFEKDLILLNDSVYMIHSKKDYMLCYTISEIASEITFSKGSVFVMSLKDLIEKELKRASKEDGDTMLYIVKNGNVDYTFTQKMQIYLRYLEER